MLYNEEAVRANIRNREGKRIFYLGKGDQLTSAARDYLSRERIEIRPGEQAKQDCFPLLTGGFLTEKPEHMTHLNGDFLVVKDHPRIIFRGKLDTLESELILCQLTDKGLEAPVGEILELARRIIRCEVLDEPLQWDRLCGLMSSASAAIFLRTSTASPTSCPRRRTGRPLPGSTAPGALPGRQSWRR